jgi:hypothetical protein
MGLAQDASAVPHHEKFAALLLNDFGCHARHFDEQFSCQSGQSVRVLFSATKSRTRWRKNHHAPRISSPLIQAQSQLSIAVPGRMLRLRATLWL